MTTDDYYHLLYLITENRDEFREEIKQLKEEIKQLKEKHIERNCETD